MEVVMNSEISTVRYRSPILITCNIGRYKYRIVANYNQESTGMTTTCIKVEKCFLDHKEIWEKVEHGTIEHKIVLEYALFNRLKSELGL
jgi:hypothetical protein